MKLFIGRGKGHDPEEVCVSKDADGLAWCNGLPVVDETGRHLRYESFRRVVEETPRTFTMSATVRDAPDGAEDAD